MDSIFTMWFQKKHNQKRFSNWVKEHHEALYKHALWMTGNSDSAADAVQETYHHAWLSIKSLRDEERVLAWLLTILKRTVYREFRQKYKFAEFVQAFDPDQENSVSNETQDDIIDVLKMMEQLSTSQRETLLLYALHGFTYQEISEQLSIPIGTVMSRIARARDEIKVSSLQGPDNVIPLKLSK